MSLSSRNFLPIDNTGRSRWLLLPVLLLLSAAVTAQDQGTSVPAKLFDTTDTLDVIISAPWRDVEKDVEYQGTYPGKIEFTDELGNATSLDLTVARRGLTRQIVCRFPPIKLRFEKGSADGTTFHGQKSLKLVTHCDKGSRWEQYYVMEMVSYFMYNLITDYSFKVRPLSITYRDSERGKDQGPRFGFLIEDDSDVAKRHGLKKLKIEETDPVNLEPNEANNFALFQLMIGNLDWSALSGPKKGCCHNAKLIGLDPETDPVYAIPYDLDSSGLVNAHYAAPPDNLKVSQVTQRLYRGFCAHNATLDNARRRYLDHEQAIYDLVDNEERLSGSNKKKGIKYLEKFFDMLRDDKTYQKDLIAKCRN